ncbi:WbqC family protein, partial [Escherichia coli]|uniref:WbqC family protein n=3 Tax=Bacteria TaxID=2 RepID=UPI0013751B8A
AIQSCYIPWKGFFDLLNRCDEYVILDGAQYVKRHWHNRNKIKTANGLQWLTIPVVTKSRYEQPIDEVEISEPDWADQHWRSIEQAYRKAPHFATYGPKVRQLYEAVAKEKLLTQVNERFLRELSALL